jgi:hypothetical protein
MNQELIDYVQAAKAAGQTVEEIRATLLAQGWDAAIVGESLGEVPQAVPPASSARILSARQVAGFSLSRLIAFGAVSAMLGEVLMDALVFLIGLYFAASGQSSPENTALVIQFSWLFGLLGNLLAATLVLKRFGKKALQAGAVGGLMTVVLVLAIDHSRIGSLSEMFMIIASLAGQLIGGVLGLLRSRGLMDSLKLKVRHVLLIVLYLITVLTTIPLTGSPLLNWIIKYLIDLTISMWIVLGGGAHFLEGTLASGVFLGSYSPRWSEEGIKIFVWGTLVFTTIWFLIGLAVPAVRLSK